ncbi:MAG: hypothetical protein AVDCRST_MAG18-1732, partial [uncultured Thermomicrobiales bacterium]
RGRVAGGSGRLEPPPDALPLGATGEGTAPVQAQIRLPDL